MDDFNQGKDLWPGLEDRVLDQSPMLEPAELEEAARARNLVCSCLATRRTKIPCPADRSFQRMPGTYRPNRRL
ncbi:hypothetical protein NG701_02140 [Pseudarthrobacter sp. HLT3-5]|nr:MULTISPECIES: hypothetical protein [unclassified Pseudarthrobacter]MCO4254965.1 hypothetical protein [Pseudarthrobacter sp. HLT1-5]MCO4273241.1 hypothetical protein [Pseudarthrobacter sp. HLT3-5]